MKVNPYTFKVMDMREKVTTPTEVTNFIKKCPEVAADEELTPEEAKRLRLEDLQVLNEIINDKTISPTTRVQAVSARQKIVKGLMEDFGIGASQRSLADLQKMLADDSTDDSDVTSEVTENEAIDTPEEVEEFTEAKVSVEDIKQQMLDDDEE